MVTSETPSNPTSQSLGRLLVLSKADYQTYRAAFYQKDFLEALKRQHHFHLYGPGFPGFDAADSYPDIFAKLGFVPDTIITAHMWLADDPKAPLDPMQSLNLAKFSGRKIGMLNKEYSRPTQKLSWFSEQGFDRVFSHHPEAESFSTTPDLDVRFLPFAADPNRFLSLETRRPIDLGFSGVLANPIFRDQQSDFRHELMREIFLCFRDYPLFRHKNWRQYRILWRTWSGDYLSDKLSRLDPRRRRLSTDEYSRAMGRTKLWLSSPSVAGIISTRYFECMMAGSVIISEPSRGLTRFFKDGSVIFVSGKQEFVERFNWLVENPSVLERLSSTARTEAKKAHSWDVRVGEFLRQATE